jgi:hypothetical protein
MSLTPDQLITGLRLDPHPEGAGTGNCTVPMAGYSGPVMGPDRPE